MFFLFHGGENRKYSAMSSSRKRRNETNFFIGLGGTGK
jgi:hypothetical protein